MTTNGPTKTSDLSVATSLSGQARVVVIATVAGSLQTMTVPLSTIQNNNIGALDTLSDVSIASPTDGKGLIYSSSRSQWIAGSVGDMKTSNNLSDVDAAAARANLDVLSSTSINLFYLSINAVAATQIQTLSNVSISAPTDSQVLVYNSATSEWVNRQLSTADISGIGSYITSASVLTALGPYITSASVVTLIGPYLTSASAVTLVANFITSASTSTMVASQLVPYLTSASAETRLATKIGAFASASDVSVSSPANGQILVYRTSDSKWHNEANTGAGIQGIVSATDVSLSVPSNGQILVYRTSDSKWHNEANTGAGIAAIASATDVTISSATLGQFLTYGVDGKWHNTTQDIPTSASVSTMITAALGAYITSASASTLAASLLVPYLTSASAESRYAIATSVTQTLTTYLSSVSASAAYASVGIFSDKKLQNISDVTVSSAANGQFIVFRTADSKWHNETFDFVTSTQVSAAIQNFITSASASSMVAALTTSFISSASASTMVASQLVPYMTSTSAYTAFASVSVFNNVSIGLLKQVSISGATDSQVLAFSSATGEWHNRQLAAIDITGLGIYVTSASLLTALGSYITSASVETRLGSFVTSASLLTTLGAYLTSASAATLNTGITKLVSASDVAITTPLEGDILIYDASAAQWKNQATDLFSPSFVAIIEEDFIGSSVGKYTLTTVGGFGITEAAGSNLVTDSAFMGIFGIGVSITNTYGKIEATVQSDTVNPSNLICSTSRSGFYRALSRVYITTLTNATSVNAQIFSGFTCGMPSSIIPSGGAFGLLSFGIGFYADGTKNTWQVLVPQSTSTTVSDLSVATTVSVNTWINLRIDVCVAGTGASVRVTHFINGAQVHQYTSVNAGAFTGATLYHAPLYISKRTTATSPIQMYIDYAKAEFIFTSLGRGTF